MGLAIVWFCAAKRPESSDHLVQDSAPMISGAIRSDAYDRAVEKAQSASARMVSLLLEQAIQQFYTEYGEHPSASAHLRTDSPEGIRLLAILQGKETTRPPRNFHSIPFLDLDSRDHNRDGTVSSSDSLIKGLHDPWGNPYIVELDNESLERLRFTFGTQAIDLRGRIVAVCSAGPDRIEGTDDDIRNW